MKYLHYLALRRVKTIIVGLKQFDARIQKEKAKQNQGDLECVDDGYAGENEPDAHGKCSENSPEKNSVLIHLWHLEVRKENSPHKHVVNAEALFNEVATHVFASCCRAELPQHDKSEEQTNADPDCRFNGSFFRVDLMCVFVHHQNVD